MGERLVLGDEELGDEEQQQGETLRHRDLRNEVTLSKENRASVWSANVLRPKYVPLSATLQEPRIHPFQRVILVAKVHLDREVAHLLE